MPQAEIIEHDIEPRINFGRSHSYEAVCPEHGTIAENQLDYLYVGSAAQQHNANIHPEEHKLNPIKLDL